MIKKTLLLTTLLFLISAPEPGANDIAQMSANFLVADQHTGLLAANEDTLDK